MKKTPGCTESVSGWIPFFFLAFTFVLVMMAVEWAKKKTQNRKRPTTDQCFPNLYTILSLIDNSNDETPPPHKSPLNSI